MTRSCKECHSLVIEHGKLYCRSSWAWITNKGLAEVKDTSAAAVGCTSYVKSPGWRIKATKPDGEVYYAYGEKAVYATKTAAQFEADGCNKQWPHIKFEVEEVVA